MCSEGRDSSLGLGHVRRFSSGNKTKCLCSVMLLVPTSSSCCGIENLSWFPLITIYKALISQKGTG